MRVPTILLVAMLGTLWVPGGLAAQADVPPGQLAASVLPLPVALRDGAGVRARTAEGVVILRQSTNGLMCTADQPGDEVFDVRCYHEEWLAVMDHVRLLRQQGVPGEELDPRLQADARQGLVRLPDSPTAGYRMLGPISAFDAATASAGDAIDKWQSVHFPFRTAEQLGLPVEREDVMPFVMSSGTWWSHVMIMHRPPSEP